MHFRLLQQEWIYFGGLNQEDPLNMPMDANIFIETVIK